MQSLYHKKYGYIFILPGVIVLALITLGPFFYDVYLSLTDRYLASADPTQFIGLKNYLYIFKNMSFWKATFITLQYVFITVILEVLIGFTMAILFQLGFRGKKILRSMILLPMVTTPIAIAFMWRIIYNPTLGILNYLLSLLKIEGILWVSDPKTSLASVILVDIWQWTPFTFLVFSAGIATLPLDPFEAAIVDGAGFFQMVIYIMLPILKPIIAIIVLFRIVDSFKTFDIIYVLTGGGPGVTTETLNIHTYLNAFKFLKMGYACALSIILIIIIIFICSFVVKIGELGLD